MQEGKRNKISKFLSLVLRHEPGRIGLHLDSNGWADVDELISKSAMNNVCFSKEDLEEVVVTNDKQRFSFSDGGTRIRANQGHSIAVELQLKPQKPPQVLFHGTVGKFLNSIKEKGLQKMDRHHVHLSADRSTAERVGNRRGEAVILTVKSYEMEWDGFEFFLSENGVWLTDHVPVRYIEFF